MPYLALSQTSFFTPEFADPQCLPEGSVGWVLRRYAPEIFPRWLFEGWHGSGRRGRPAWPAAVLMTTRVMASREGITSRRAMVRRLARDTGWRAACGLDIGGPTPDEATFRRFEQYMRQRDPASGVPRELLWHEHIVRLCLQEGVVGEQATWMMDSTPMWCFGALRGTFRMLGDGLRSLCRRWARLTGQTLEQLAADWELPLLLTKSTKAAFRIDWKDAEARAGAVDELARSVLEVIGRIREQIEQIRATKRKALLRCCRVLAKVLANDLETDDDGRLVIARRVAQDRLVSVTDPQARSSRKSKSHSYKGFKVHLLGDLVSGLIASVSVTPANIGDGQVAHRLIRRARALCEDIQQVLGDTAYGGGELRKMARELEGVDILAPSPPISTDPERFGSADFAIDLVAAEATCPAGHTVPLRVGKQTRYFRWNKSLCDACPLRSKCVAASNGTKTIPVRPHYEEVLAIRERWSKPEIRERYRTRAQGERLINEQVRRGCRHAHAWGIGSATSQAYVAAAGINLALLARTLASSHTQLAA